MFTTQEVNLTIATGAESTTNGKTFSFDFDKGDFNIIDGKVVTLTGIEALKMWITKVLKTEKFKFKIYNTTETEKYGVALLDLVNSGYPLDYIKSEIQREVTETLIKNTEIESVSNFEFNRDIKRMLSVNFKVNSIYGTTEKEVII